jgi:uncharacterized protein (DUF885 family)
MLISFSFLFLLFSSCSHRTEPSTKISETVKLNAFFEEVFEANVSRYPTWQTYLGRKTNYGLLDNETEAYSQENHQISHQTLARLNDFDYEALNDEGKTSYRIMKYQLEMQIEGYRWRYHGFPLNQMFGYQSETPSFMIDMHRIESEEDAKAYISRLKEIKRVFSERMIYVKKQESLGIKPPHFVFEKVIADSKNIITGKPFQKKGKSSPLYEDFEQKISKLKASKDSKQNLLNDAQMALVQYVLPAYQELITYLEGLEKKASLNQGAWSLPNGKEFYDFQLKGDTTTDLNAEEIHQIGLSEVKRIQGEMLEIMKQVNFKGSLQDFFTHMRGKKYAYPDSAAGRKAYLAEVAKVLKEIKAELPKLFMRFPKAELIVKPVEAYREKSAGTAFYSGPSMEGNRPGIYYVNLYKMADNPKYKLEALAYHEAIPGHHMQIAIAKELEGLPKFRRSGGFTAYVEGWGLYSELLPQEIGFYKNPYSDFGRLSMEIWRATRLVVDTGIHSKKWTREQAIAFMRENTPSAELETVKEIERYFIMPGQATAYKVGMMKILELRKRAKEALGDKFDIREFHDVILKDGSLPLQVLEDKVNQWIKEARN